MKNWLLPAVVTVMIIRLVLMLLLPLTDPTEGRYANTGREMALRGDWVTPHVWVGGELVPFLGKPPLHFWAEAVCVKIFGDNEFAVRLPAWLGASALLGIMWFVLARFRDRWIATTAVVITVTTGLFWGLAGAVATDMSLAATASGAVICYMGFVLSDSKRLQTFLSLCVFILLALAFLTKGPVGLVMFGLPVFFWTLINKRWDTLKNHAWVSGSLLFLILTVPWFVISERHNPGFLHYFFINENFLRFVTPNYGDLYGSGHIYPRGSAIGMLLVGALPWSLFLPVLLWRQRSKEKRMTMLRDPMGGMAFLGVVSITLFWCFARQLLTTYLLPAIPLLAVWLALRIPKAKAVPRVAWSMVLCLLVSAVIILPVMAGKHSLRYVLREINQEETLADSRFLFVRKTPHSAYFYTRKQIISHPRESVSRSLETGKMAGPEALLVFKKKYYSRTSPEDRAQMDVILDAKEWVVARWRADTYTKNASYQSAN